jgi:hypothetical protein
MELQTLLAGPIVRRVERNRVCLWVATSHALDVAAEVYAIEGPALRRVGVGTAESVKLGERLFVHLVQAHPDGDEFPVDELLGYDLRFTTDGGEVKTLADFGLLQGPRRVTYGDFPLPTFFIRKEIPELHVMHGSCRLLHGRGEDAMLSADEEIAKTAGDPARRPSALFLTGDQVYADEVAGPMIRHVTALGRELVGDRDEHSVPGAPPLSSLPLYGRAGVIQEQARFTSEKADNHLMSFGEFAAMYLVAWNEANWPARFPTAREAIPAGRRASTARLRSKYGRELTRLERARAALPATRRVLANVPTYMMFDDHDTTDDWNLTQYWRDTVQASRTGRRIVSNALASFWAFQGWGNDPDVFDASFKRGIAEYVAGEGQGEDPFEARLWSFDRWSFRAPTSPPVLVFDTRTQRSYDAPEGAARLIGAAQRDRIASLARESGHQPGDLLIIVSPVPVFGLEVQERRQKYLVDKVGPYEIDFEAWHSNLRGHLDLMHLLIEDLGLGVGVFLSGDVHYGFNARASFTIADKTLSAVQFVSSAQKHSGGLSKQALRLFGHLVSKDHERVGWDQPPSTQCSASVRDKLMFRVPNMDEWNEASPIFLNPRHLGKLKIDEPPRYREIRSYVRVKGADSSTLVGENNIGVVSLNRSRVAHRLLSRQGDRTNVHSAAVEISPDRTAIREVAR